MHWHDEIILKLPSPHEDEPRNLRQDILDELEDHLSCAMQRELRHTDDARLARQRVLTSFGNPAKVARRLWLDAMKGTLMNQRIMLGTNVLLAAVTITMCIVVLFVLRDTMRSNEVILAQLEQTTRDLILAQSRHGNSSAGAAVAGEVSEDGDETDAVGDVRDREQQRAALRQRLSDQLTGLDANWRHAAAAGNQLVQIPPEEGFAILHEAWGDIQHFQARQQIIKSFAFTAMRDLHPHIIDVMHLGMTDESTQVQGWAINYLRWMAFEDFSTDFDTYDKWRARHEGKPARQIIIDSLNDWTERLIDGDENARILLHETNMLALRDQSWLRNVARETALPNVLADIIEAGAAPDADAPAREDADGAIRRVSELQMDEAYLRRVIVPIVTNDATPQELLGNAHRALHGPQNAWARDTLLERLEHAVLSENRHQMRGSIWSLASTIATYEDPSVIPTLIALIDFDNTYTTVYGIGYFGLNPLTGVRYNESHDGAWWCEWWVNNRGRFPVAVRDMDIPEVDEQPARQAAHDREHAGLHHADGNENKGYFLIRADRDDAPEDGYKLLLILPGGDGSADFQPFITRIHDNALGDDWIIAQLVAPVWDPQQPNMVVWPTRGMPWEGMKFSTEEFIDAVMADVIKQHPIDERHIYAMGWSSGGPPVYAATMRKETKLRGAFVAMSVFHPQQYPDPAGAKGRAFYLLHSPDDFIQMRFPDQAKRMLSEAGAIVELTTYQGGHGWHGDVFGMIRHGIEWLAHQSAEDATESAP